MPQGYRYVVLSKNGVKRNHTVHSLVALAFHGPPPIGHEVDHDDEDKANNRPSNLIYRTHGDNVRRYHERPGRTFPIRGQARRNAVLTDDAARAIVARYAAGGETHRTLARAFGCHHAGVAAILQGRAWTHATGLKPGERVIAGTANPRRDLPLERWAPVSVHPRYEVSDLGRVRSLRTGRLLKPVPNGKSNSGRNRAWRVMLGDRNPHLVHALVAAAFLPAPPRPSRAVPLDGNYANPRADNLTWVPCTRGPRSPPREERAFPHGIVAMPQEAPGVHFNG